MIKLLSLFFFCFFLCEVVLNLRLPQPQWSPPFGLHDSPKTNLPEDRSGLQAGQSAHESHDILTVSLAVANNVYISRRSTLSHVLAVEVNVAY